MKRLSLAASLAASMWACNGRSPTSPGEPTLPTAPPPPRATYTLSGVVSGVTPAGQGPVEGALVEVLTRRLSATTDKSGSYRIDGVFDGPTSVRVTEYIHETVSRDVTIAGDTRLDVQLVQRATYVVSGVVSEMTPTGLMPVAGVRVFDSYFHAEAATDSNGFYKFEGPFGGIRDSFGFVKEGYQTVNREVTINGHTQLDVQLVRR